MSEGLSTDAGKAPGPEYVFRPIGILVIEVLDALIVTAIPLLIAIAATPSPWNTLVLLFGLLGLCLAVRRGLRVGVFADEEGITVKNYWRTHHLKYRHIAEVTASWETLGVVPAPVIAFRLFGNCRLVRAQASAVGERNRRRFLRELTTLPGMATVRFDVPPDVLREPVNPPDDAKSGYLRKVRNVLALLRDS